MSRWGGRWSGGWFGALVESTLIVTVIPGTSAIHADPKASEAVVAAASYSSTIAETPSDGKIIGSAAVSAIHGDGGAAILALPATSRIVFTFYSDEIAP